MKRLDPKGFRGAQRYRAIRLEPYVAPGVIFESLDRIGQVWRRFNKRRGGKISRTANDVVEAKSRRAFGTRGFGECLPNG
jgi:hypothetical protein